MKKHPLLIFLFLLFLGPGMSAQNLTVLPIYGYDLHLDKSGERLAFTDIKSKNFWIYDLTSGELEDSGISSTGVLIDEFEGESFSLQHRDEEIRRFRYSIDQKSLISTDRERAIIAYPSSDLRAIVLQEGSKKRLLQPIKGCDFINVSLSPNKTHILFRATGNGSFIIDLEGNIVSKFQNAQFPSWVNDEEILFAEVVDDGHQYLSSSLFQASFTGKKVREIELSKDIIPLFPVASQNGKEIYFSTPKNSIMKLELEK